jgi:hypothetical protein
LNDQIGNLRPATQSQNLANSTLSSKNTSGYKGVRWDNRREHWTASIMVNYKGKFLGSFNTAEEAHAAYCAAAKKHFGEFACDGERAIT